MCKKFLLGAAAFSVITLFASVGYACDEHKAQNAAVNLEPAAGEEHGTGDGHNHNAQSPESESAPANADGDHHESLALKQVEAKQVCMMNNKFMGVEQISIEVDGKTYYGCCPMCKERLKNEAAARQAVDPISGNTVDKAAAVIGAAPDNTVYYFESEENLQKFSSDPSRYLNPVTVEP
ncbi:MAG: TRASH domain-containing protein [Micavibrio aeruginosavorus]|uniref:TRASH domain-containing protein n=1 Tax=Micavibrio aeruginosavorus TaxID=349221 RepID=A0A7T5R3E6_9BACT|nr:MAG: TRASH domain-containing protein [Micavibrio aeruginosavorus]